jgi:hypothetical protein
MSWSKIWQTLSKAYGQARATRQHIAFESLEKRSMLTTTLFLDFGADLISNEGIISSFSMTAGDLFGIRGLGLNGKGTGPNLVDGDISPKANQVIPGSSPLQSLHFRPLNYDYVGADGFNSQDITALSTAVLAEVSEILRPFAIDIQLVSASSRQDIIDAMTGSDAIDAYVFVGDVRSDYYAATFGNASVGTVNGKLGLEPATDWWLQQNIHDEMALTFADHTLASTTGVQFTDDFNARLVKQLAKTATHEALHSLGIRHTSDFLGVAAGDIMAQGVADSRQIITRHELPGDARQNVYDLLAADPNIGLRDANANGKSDLIYITGTGTADEITIQLDPLDPTQLRVDVVPYYDDTFSVTWASLSPSILDSATYYVTLDDFDGEILVEGGFGSDRITIDANISAAFRVRGLLGDDQVTLVGHGASALLSLVFEGEQGDDVLVVDFQNGDPLPLPGFDFNFRGGAGTDSAAVIEPGNVSRTAYFVNQFADGAAVGDEHTLRSAVQAANAAANKTYIIMPAGTYPLSIAGAGGDSQGDLDVSKPMTLIGAGAGATVIDAAAIDDRIFDVAATGNLALSRLTLTGGNSAGSGGALQVVGGTLSVDQAAIVGNASAVGGGAIFNASGTVTVTASVIAGNAAPTGAAIRSQGPSGAAATTIGNSIVAQNDNTVASDDLHVLHDSGSGAITSAGNNLSDRPGLSGAAVFAHGVVGDVVQSFAEGELLVVTEVGDSFDATFNAGDLSLREAIRKSNVDLGRQTVWLPAWHFTLTRVAPGGGTDQNVAYGDLDITANLTIRGIRDAIAQVNLTAIDARLIAVDRIFDAWLQGDFNGSVSVTSDDLGQVLFNFNTTGHDFEDGDANNDGVVDGDDLGIVLYNFNGQHSLEYDLALAAIDLLGEL